MIKHIILLTMVLATIAAVVVMGATGTIVPHQCFPILVESFRCHLK